MIANTPPLIPLVIDTTAVPTAPVPLESVIVTFGGIMLLHPEPVAVIVNAVIEPLANGLRCFGGVTDMSCSMFESTNVSPNAVPAYPNNEPMGVIAVTAGSAL